MKKDPVASTIKLRCNQTLLLEDASQGHVGKLALRTSEENYDLWIATLEKIMHPHEVNTGVTQAESPVVGAVEGKTEAAEGAGVAPQGPTTSPLRGNDAGTTELKEREKEKEKEKDSEKEEAPSADQEEASKTHFEKLPQDTPEEEDEAERQPPNKGFLRQTYFDPNDHLKLYDQVSRSRLLSFIHPHSHLYQAYEDCDWFNILLERDFRDMQTSSVFKDGMVARLQRKFDSQASRRPAYLVWPAPFLSICMYNDLFFLSHKGPVIVSQVDIGSEFFKFKKIKMLRGSKENEVVQCSQPLFH